MSADAVESRPPRPAPGSGRSAFATGLRVLTPIGLFILALGVRCAPWREVFGLVRTVPVGSDAYYHLRRVAFAVFRHPAFLDFDPYLQFPEGAKPIWPPLFDRAVATVLRPLVADPLESGLPELERLAMWVPAVLGAATVVAVYALMRRHFGFGTGLLAGGVLCFLSGHFWYSQLGFLDHHVAVGLMATAVLASGMGMLGPPAATRWGHWSRAALLGVLSALALLLWPGSLLHVGLVHAALLAALLGRAAREARSGFCQLCVAYGVALGLLAPAGLASDWPQWGAFSPVVLSYFQPWLFAVAMGVCGGCALVWRSERWDSPLARLATFAGAVALALTLSLLSLPDLSDGALDAWRWLTKSEAFQSRVAESAPLFAEASRFTVRIALVRLSGFALVLPLAIAWLATLPRSAEERGPLRVLLVFSAGLFAAALLQRRFFHGASIGLACVFALTAVELWRRAGTGALRAALVGLFGLLLAPTLEPYAAPLANEWYALRGEKTRVGGSFALTRAQLEMATWLRTHTPPTSGWLEEGGAPEYGVLAPWPLGHVIQYAGRRPTVVDNFGDDLGEGGFAFAERVFRAPESHAIEWIEGRRVRYVVVQESAGFLGSPPPVGSLLRSLYVRDGSGSELPGASPALAQHRFAFESKGLYFSERKAEAVYKVFEVVPGALIVGQAAPGELVGVRLGVFTNRGRKFVYRTHGVADAAGEYRVRVPYATDGGPHGIRTGPLYRVSCGTELGGVAVPEQAVVEGRSVVGPPLCRDDDGPGE